MLCLVKVLPAQVISATGSVNNVICNGQHNGSISYQIIGGPGPIHYTWNTGDSGIATGSCTYAVNLNNPGAALSRFQVQVNVALAPGMNSNFSNIFFVDSSGAHIPFWLQDFPGASNATFWVRVPSIPSGNSAIFLSFCGSDSESNPYTTFEFFDNFDSGLIPAWRDTCTAIDVAGEFCNMAADNTISFSPRYSLHLSAHGSCFVPPYDGAGSQASRTTPMVNDSLVIDFEDRVSVELYGYCSGGTGTTNQVFADGNYLGNGQSISHGGTCAINTSGWALKTSGPFAVSTGTTTIKLGTSGGDCDNSNGWFDDVRVRKYRTFPPVVTLDTTPQLVLDSLVAGVYVLTMRDSAGNITTQSFTVTQPGPLVVMADSTDITCSGLSNGRAWVNVSGGNPHYSYMWSNSQTSDTITGLSQGTYAVTVTDSLGCTATGSTRINDPAPMLFVADSVNVKCFGASTGSAWVTVSGGQTPYSYLWNNGQSTDTASALAYGVYSVTINDFNGCSASVSIHITQPLSAISLTADSADITCFGAANGRAWANASGGTGAFSYLWSSSQATDSISGLSAGSYTVTVQDANQCTASASTQINTPAASIIATAFSAPDCHNANGAIAWVVVAGGAIPYNYLWSNSQNTDTITGLASGIYTVTVSDNHGCMATAGTGISQPAVLLNASASALPELCFGGSTGSAVVLAAGGTSPYTYIWSNGNSQDSIANLVAGVYAATVTDSSGCTVTVTAVINQPTAINLQTGQNKPSCGNLGSGALSATAGGGSAPWRFLWSNGDTTQNVTGLLPGNYTVTVTDANGCTQTMSDSVIFDSFSVQIQALPDTIVGYGGTVQLTVQGSGVASAVWNPALGLDNPQSVSVTATPLVNTVYYVSALTSNGCSAVDSIHIHVKDLPKWFIPNAFTPNGDGNNDYFNVFVSGPVEILVITIFDRIGEKIYEQLGGGYTPGWDGTYKGKKVPPGAYVYYVQLKNSFPVNAETINLKGTVTVIR